MNKRCQEILQELENEGKIKIWKDFKFPEPQELKLKLKDLLEENVDEKYYLSDKLIAGLIKHTERHEEKGHGFKFQTTEGEGIASSITTRVGACRTGDNYIRQVGELDIKGHDCVKRVYSPEGISPTLTNMQGGNRQPKIIEDNYIINKYNNFIDKRGYMPDMFNPYNDAEIKDVAPTQSTACGCMTSSATVLVKEATAVAQRGRYNPDGKVEQQLELSDREYANAITTIQKDSMACIKDKIIIDDTQGFDSTRIYKDYSPSLKASRSGLKTIDQLRIRKLSPRECWRLMRV